MKEPFFQAKEFRELRGAWLEFRHVFLESMRYELVGRRGYLFVVGVCVGALLVGAFGWLGAS